MNPESSTYYDHFVSFLKSLLNLTVPREDFINVMADAKHLALVITRHAIVILSNLATPEEIHMSRTILPQDVIQHHFEQQHYLLKDLLENTRSKASSSRSMSKYIIHTRSNAHILGILFLRTDIWQSSSIAVARTLITDNPAAFIIEHMNF